MTSPILAMRAAIVACCAADLPLATLMGGPAAIRDEPPAGSEPLHVHFGDGRLADWSTSSDGGHEQEVELVVWAQPGSAASGIAVAERLVAILDDAALALDGHRLVAIRLVATEIRRDPDADLARVAVQFRAVTEVAA